MSVPAVLVCLQWKKWRQGAGQAALLLLLVISVARGQTAATGQPVQVPARMARLTFLAGQVQVQGINSGNAQPAVLNEPIFEGAALSTANDGQAEMEFEDGSVVRLTPNSALSVVKLSVDSHGNLQTLLALLRGVAYLELRSSPRYLYTLDAQGDEIAPLENSTFRVNLDQPPAAIAVLDGKIRVTARSGGMQAEATAGQTLRSAAAPGQVSIGNYLVKDGIDPDSWDQWNVDRDVAAANAAANHTTARNGFAGDQGYGWSDLDANGSWYALPGQGEVWQPDVAADASAGMDAFDPYGYGDWNWSPDNGYVWASGYSWGWTPYRCGNWQYWGGFGWGWSPGPSCGVYGFGGHGFRINLRHFPPIYHGPRRPPAGPLPIHPPVAVHGGVAPTSIVAHVLAPRTIEGTQLQPLQPIGSVRPAANGFALGAALNRDFPVDRTTHQPVTGTVANHSMPLGAIGNGARATWRPALRPGSGVALRSQAARPAYVPPANQTQRPSEAPGTSGFRAPGYTPPPVPHYTPPPVPRYSPPPAAPRYAPPPAPVPRAAAPAAPPAAAAPRGR